MLKNPALPAQPSRAKTRSSAGPFSHHPKAQQTMERRPIRDSKDGAVLTVHVQPKAGRTVCVGVHGEALKIRIAAPPVGGAANRELLRFLADQLSLPVAAVHIESGESSRHKRVRLEGTTAVHVMARLMPHGVPKA